MFLRALAQTHSPARRARIQSASVSESTGADPLARAFWCCAHEAWSGLEYQPEAQARGSGSAWSDADNMVVSHRVRTCVSASSRADPLACASGWYKAFRKREVPERAQAAEIVKLRDCATPKSASEGVRAAIGGNPGADALRKPRLVGVVAGLPDTLARASGSYATEDGADTLSRAFWCCAHEAWSGLEYQPEAQARGSGWAGSDADSLEGSQYVGACLPASSRADPLACASGWYKAFRKREVPERAQAAEIVKLRDCATPKSASDGVRAAIGGNPGADALRKPRLVGVVAGLPDTLARASGSYATEDGAGTLARAFWCCAHEAWSGLEYQPEAQARGSGWAWSDVDNMVVSQRIRTCVSASSRADPLACASGW